MGARNLNSRVLACLLMCLHTFVLAAYLHWKSILISPRREPWLSIRACLTITPNRYERIKPQLLVDKASFKVQALPQSLGPWLWYKRVCGPKLRLCISHIHRHDQVCPDRHGSKWPDSKQTRFFRDKSSFTIGIFYEWSAEGYANEGDWERDGGWGISDISYPVRLPPSVGSKHTDVAT